MHHGPPYEGEIITSARISTGIGFPIMALAAILILYMILASQVING
jgi:hypothetical protein